MVRTTRMTTTAIMIFLLACSGVTLLLSGCGSTNRVTSAHAESRNVTGDDWVHFAQEMQTSILQNRVLDRYARAGERVFIVIGDFKNKTSLLDLEERKNIMYNEIKRALVNTQRITVSKEIVGTGGDKDSLVSRLKTLASSEDYLSSSTQDLTGKALGPRLVLYGEFNEIRTFKKDGGDEVRDFFCNCELIDAQSRGVVWSEQFRIKKVTE